MIETIAKAVCDAGPIIHLDELNCLDLLNDFEEILVSDAVEKEIEKHRTSALQSSDLKLKRFKQQFAIANQLLTFCQVFSLDLGETQALALMEMNPHAIFLTDDAAARMVAEQMRFKVHGTIGIIIRSIRRGQKKPKEVIQILSEIPLKSTLYIKSSLLDKILQRIEKEFHL
jgi:predicted nucleic acid-binding protein